MNSRLFITKPVPDVLEASVGNFRCRSKRPKVRFGSKATLEEGPLLADSVAKVFLSHRSQIFRAVGAAIEN
jgi:hypothetical protein